MSINFTFMATEADIVVYFEDGSSKSFPPQQEEHFQLPSGSMCTFSSTAGREEEDEHMQPQPPSAEEFAERMLAFWTGMLDRARAAQQPSAEVQPANS
ncbi:MAG: hypothetical protein DMF62_03555 [Acidobacteria bacterium]|nr:MAG: hypothetical protein DMF62_03555 [Acidobacteriota bacterium]